MSDEIPEVREWVGSQPDDATIAATLSRHPQPRRAALAILRARLADMEAEAAVWAVAGDWSQSSVANITALRDKVGRLERDLDLDDDGLATMTSTPICGPRLGR